MPLEGYIVDFARSDIGPVGHNSNLTLRVPTTSPLLFCLRPVFS